MLRVWNWETEKEKAEGEKSNKSDWKWRSKKKPALIFDSSKISNVQRHELE